MHADAHIDKIYSLQCEQHCIFQKIHLFLTKGTAEAVLNAQSFMTFCNSPT